MLLPSLAMMLVWLKPSRPATWSWAMIMMDTTEALTSTRAPFWALPSLTTIVRSLDGWPLSTTVTVITATVATSLCINPFSPTFCLIVAKWVLQSVQRHTGVTHLSYFDIGPLWSSVLSARMPKCQKIKKVGYTSMALNTLKSNNFTPFGLKWLTYKLRSHMQHWPTNQSNSTQSPFTTTNIHKCDAPSPWCVIRLTV